jgi:hypothetical protein
MNDFMQEVIRAEKVINKEYSLYPKITILTNRYVDFLGNTQQYPEEYLITFNPTTMSFSSNVL